MFISLREYFNDKVSKKFYFDDKFYLWHLRIFISLLILILI